MVELHARKLIATPSERQECPIKPNLKSYLLLTEPSGLLYSTLTSGRFARFPEKTRLDVAMAVARAVDVEIEPDEQIRMVEKCLGNLGKIYEIGGEKAVLAWCRAIRESSCFFESSNMSEILSEAVRWIGKNGDGRGADAYKRNALLCGAEILMEPKIAAVLERAQEEVGEEVVPTLATAFMAIAARWGISRAAKVAESIQNMDMCKPDFLFSTLEICKSSGTELDALTSSLEKHGGLLWAVPGINRGVLETLVLRPGRIVNAILGEEGFPSDSLLHNAMEQRERLGFLSIIADRRALGHPDKVVRGAAAKRLAFIAADQDYSIRMRISAVKALSNTTVVDEIGDEEILKLKDVLEDEKSPIKVREGIGVLFVVGFCKSHNDAFFFGQIRPDAIKKALAIADFIKREDRPIAIEMTKQMLPFAGPWWPDEVDTPRKLVACVEMVRLPEVIKTIRSFKSMKNAAEVAGIFADMTRNLIYTTWKDDGAEQTRQTAIVEAARTIGALADAPDAAISMAREINLQFELTHNERSMAAMRVNEVVKYTRQFRKPEAMEVIKRRASLGKRPIPVMAWYALDAPFHL